MNVPYSIGFSYPVTTGLRTDLEISFIWIYIFDYTMRIVSMKHIRHLLKELGLKRLQAAFVKTV